MADTKNRSENSGFFASIKRSLSGRTTETSLRESLEEAIEEHEEETRAPALGIEERTMLFNILEYGELRVNDVMVPRADITAVDQDSDFSNLLKVFSDAAHSRMPVYRETLDDVIGMVHVKDMLKAIADGANSDSFRIKAIQRPVLFVPPSMKVIDLLAKMRASRTHMAIVVDEYGGTDGLVTVEDMVEEIVGEIEDEHDTEQDPEITTSPDGYYDADARAEIELVEETLGASLLSDDIDEDINTLGGLVFSSAGHIPEIGEIIHHSSGHSFEVLDADPRRIHKIRIYSSALDAETQ
ncbi:hemolysin family protein [Kordiimonas sp. SCSIO 12610]|uniref:hemolysin family protein n=1 Tax=Kordiimonas sp. SCSIO 12610 TaxID=2829597 RepID=UPI00210DF03B|nr:hemolysin family protein [Kordiimonas sp. SCSIO 12610]UTW55093.1 HlyC/CorC family transporter [Kordiimonas sp. SCSIO 12610]